ncbi:MAG: hypothetical protein RIF46_12475 [Cyclobacteriaceae bacterium]
MKYLLPVLLTFSTIACSTKSEMSKITTPSDYNQFLQSTQDNTALEEEIEFWATKIAAQPKAFTYLQKQGTAYLKLFKQSGNIELLHSSFDKFKEANSFLKGKSKASNLLTLSELSIMKHDFDAARVYAEEALQLTDEKFGPEMMRFDAYMELGDYMVCKTILERNKRMDSFDYLVRLGKFKDHEGNLDSAIVYMERAEQMIRNEKSPRALWINANLGDMYGHAGRISESYEKYIKVLNLESNYDYALKGIAWIAYSADRNISEARRILTVLHSKTNLPDHHLSLAELAEFENNFALATKHIDAFVSEASKPEYKGMYNKYLIEIYADRGDFQSAFALANDENRKRPTPATYDWLAWTNHLAGNKEVAISIYENMVEGKTEEPDVLYHMAMAFSENGIERGKDYLKEVQEASYELGPVLSQKINNTLH